MELEQLLGYHCYHRGDVGVRNISLRDPVKKPRSKDIALWEESEDGALVQ